MKTNLKGKILAILLAFIMVFALMPQMAVFGPNAERNDSIVYADDKSDVDEAVDIYMAAMSRLFNRENNPDFEELAKCMEHLENLDTLYSFAEGTVSILEAMGIIEDPTDAMLSQILSSVEAVQDKLAVMDIELGEIIDLLEKMAAKDDENARYNKVVTYQNRWDAIEIGTKGQLKKDLEKYQAHIEDGKKAWCNEGKHSSLRVLYAKDDEGTGLLHVYSGNSYEQGVPDKSDAGETILKDECIGLPGTFIPEDIPYNKKTWTTDVKAGMQTAFTNAANAKQLEWTSAKQAEWDAMSDDDKKIMAEQYAGDLVETLLHVISCKMMSSNHVWAADVYSDVELFCSEVKKPQFGLDALIQLYYNSNGLEGETREAIEETCDSVIATTGYYGLFLFNMMGQDDEYDDDDINKIQQTWADTIKALAEMKKNSITGYDNFSYITGTLIDYKKLSANSTITMHYAAYSKDGDKGVINEGVDSDPWKLVDENNKEQKELSITDDVSAAVLYHQFKLQSKSGQQTFAKYLNKNAVQIPDDFSGNITTFYQGAEVFPLSGEDLPWLLSSKVMGKHFETEKSYQINKTKYKDKNFILHDMVVHNYFDCEKGKRCETKPLTYRAAFSDSSGWWLVDEMYAFRADADFDKKTEFKWKEPKHWRFGSPKYHYDRTHYLSAPVNVLTSSSLEQATSEGTLKTLTDDIKERHKKSTEEQTAFSKANWSKMDVDNLDLYPDNDTRMDNGIKRAIKIAVEAAEDNGLKVSLTKKQETKLVKQMKKKTFDMQKELGKSGVIRQLNVFGIDGNNARELELAERTLQGTYLSTDGKSLIPSENMNTMAEYEPYAVLHFEKKNGKVKPVIEAAFDVTPLVVIWDSGLKKFYATPVDNGDIKAMGLTMKVRLPASFIKTRYANVIHYDSAENMEIMEKKTLKVHGKGNNRYVEMPATSGSPFELRKSNGPKAGGTAPAKLTAKGKTSLVLSWGKIKGAEGYDIFFSKCGKAAHKKVKTIKGTKTLRYTLKNLKKKTAYKASVKAWVMKDGKKKYMKGSWLVHAYTSGGTKNYTNAKNVTVEKKSVSLQVGKKYTIKAKVNKLKKNKKLMPTSHTAKLRYFSSNSKIAAVSRIGRVKGISRGTCTVYVYAHNGVFKKIKVTVK